LKLLKENNRVQQQTKKGGIKRQKMKGKKLRWQSIEDFGSIAQIVL
jgi:hypothetical protein